MPDTVVAEFHAAEGKLDELLAALKQALPETRAYDGCPASNHGSTSSARPSS